MTLVKPGDWQPRGVAELEDRALQALRETERSVCVTAGAGAGKTEFLAQKAAYLLQTGLCPAPKRILAISFKRDAAATLAERVKRRCAPEQARRFTSVTFDAFSKGLIDQFHKALPDAYRPPANYRIGFPTSDAVNDFLRRHNRHGVNATQFQNALIRRRLLDGDQEVNGETEALRDAYWRDQYEYYEEPVLTFPMINRLAEYLIRTNHRVCRAIRLSYPVVFLDEFQDTQASQFEVLQRAFNGAGTVLTAVGDDKQKIMGWAGAMPNAFQAFRDQYSARPISLLLNWRSHAELVAVQHIIASNINPDVEPVVARGQRNVEGDVSAIWEFADEETEIAVISEWIEGQVASGTPAHDIAILVRARADRVENELGPALADRGLILRNLARNVGEISIEDVLSEELTQILMPILHLATSKRHPEAWSTALENFSRLYAVSPDDDDQLQRLNDRMQSIVRGLRAFLAEHAVAATNPNQISDLLIEEIDEALIRRSTPAYQRDADYLRVKQGFDLLLAEAMNESDDWRAVLDRFEGRNQIPLLTVHKSKGMEFHTMIFFGFDSRTWWSLTPDKDEEKNSFFVAFTRARQRAFFTSCLRRGGRITWLEDLLGNAVPRIEGVMIL
ncbi:UvrD-helicase domain-containing protein [Paracoccus marcusii]|uniref:DNA 3'-5' helicase n=1 Tax=Paracoccus marcusii TaxID=59779 RepID=A0ABY7UVG1_9RHOB|nr:ATP-dependent helicase [Paracoccus marcusii]WDA13436.1 ATP-dependent helicase [Paracoccus marcusii]